MLVLSRRTSEKIVLRVPGRADCIEIMVTQIDNSKVRLGIEAERDISIMRSELESQ